MRNNARLMPLSNARTPQENIYAIASEWSFIKQGEGVNYVGGRGSDSSIYLSKFAL